MVEVPRTRYVAVDGLEVAYQVIGDLPLDLVYMTGTISHIDMRWEDPASARFLEGLASFSRVIVFDRRGVGASDRLTPGRGAELGGMGRRPQSRLGYGALGTCRVVCHWHRQRDMAVSFAAMHPERVQALVLFNALGRGPRFDDDPDRRWSDFSAEFAEQFWGTKEYVPAVVSQRDARSGADRLVGEVHAGDSDATGDGCATARHRHDGYALHPALATSAHVGDSPSPERNKRHR